jgi:hypothetical protein
MIYVITVLSLCGCSENRRFHEMSWQMQAFSCSKAPVIVVMTKKVLHMPSVAVALLIQRAMRLHHIVVCGLFGSAAFFHII